MRKQWKFAQIPLLLYTCGITCSIFYPLLFFCFLFKEEGMLCANFLLSSILVSKVFQVPSSWCEAKAARCACCLPLVCRCVVLNYHRSIILILVRTCFSARHSCFTSAFLSEVVGIRCVAILMGWKTKLIQITMSCAELKRAIYEQPPGSGICRRLYRRLHVSGPIKRSAAEETCFHLRLNFVMLRDKHAVGKLPLL